MEWEPNDILVNPGASWIQYLAGKYAWPVVSCPRRSSSAPDKGDSKSRFFVYPVRKGVSNKTPFTKNHDEDDIFCSNPICRLAGVGHLSAGAWRLRSGAVGAQPPIVATVPPALKSPFTIDHGLPLVPEHARLRG